MKSPFGPPDAPTCCRNVVFQSNKASITIWSVSRGMPSDSINGFHNSFEICRAIRARA